jgi:serine/threonine protein kinase
MFDLFQPENVMFVTQDSNDLKIIDYGLAQKLEEGKTVKVLFGTAEFCAPEIISFDPVSFSTGVFLQFQLLHTCLNLLY